ncbi:MAG: ArsR/SmtB family transcription factor [Phycisphaerales bacterium]
MSIADAKPIPGTALERAASALRVLAHPDRLRIIECVEVTARSVGEIAERCGLAPAACSQHLSQMRAHGLVASKRLGRSVLYHVSDPRALSVIECIRAHLVDPAVTPGSGRAGQVPAGKGRRKE